MWSAESMRWNIKIISTCLSLVACLVIICCVQPIVASIECYQHDGFLETEGGKFIEMGTCESSSSICYESYQKTEDKAARSSKAVFKAGCSECTPNPNEECRTCKEEKCNDNFATKIKANNTWCIISNNEDENAYGSRTALCSEWIKHCYYRENKNEATLIAGCGKGMTDTPDPNEKFCSIPKHSKNERFCNKPSSIGSKGRLAASENLKNVEDRPNYDGGQGDNKPSSSETKVDETKVDGPNVDGTKPVTTTDKKNGTPKKKPQEAEDFYDNSSDTQTVVWTTCTVLAMIAICMRY